MTTNISAPVFKATTALVAGAGTSYGSSVMSAAANFWPTNFAEWMAAGASGAALVYSLTLLCEWWWKKFLRGRFITWGLYQPWKKR
jgi:tetrahydromethanopterin S-methyltransferase subunit D